MICVQVCICVCACAHIAMHVRVICVYVNLNAPPHWMAISHLHPTYAQRQGKVEGLDKVKTDLKVFNIDGNTCMVCLGS